jgi:protein-S-isoprenylcysteine O-methyltransferase Ste14
MKGSRVFGVLILLLGLLAVPFFKDAIAGLLLTGIWVGMLILVLVFVVGGTILVAIRGED